MIWTCCDASRSYGAHKFRKCFAMKHKPRSAEKWADGNGNHRINLIFDTQKDSKQLSVFFSHPAVRYVHSIVHHYSHNLNVPYRVVWVCSVYTATPEYIVLLTVDCPNLFRIKRANLHKNSCNPLEYLFIYQILVYVDFGHLNIYKLYRVRSDSFSVHISHLSMEKRFI